MVFSCLEALAKHPEAGQGLVEAAFLIGAPVDTDSARWSQARSVVAHRLVNGCAAVVSLQL